MKDDPRPLHVAFLGPLTDMASALLIEPQLAKRNVRVVWIGGGEWPVGGREYNLLNDIAAANVVYRSGIEIWQIPSPVYKMMAVSYAELHERVFDKGPLGKYLVEQLIDWNSRMVPGPIEHRSLGDSPAIGIMMYPDCGKSSWVAAPQFTNPGMNYVHEGKRGTVRLYRNVDQRFIQEDFFAKLNRFTRGISRVREIWRLTRADVASGSHSKAQALPGSAGPADRAHRGGNSAPTISCLPSAN